MFCKTAVQARFDMPDGSTQPLEIKDLGLIDYQDSYTAMQAFTAARTADTPDALWLCQHPPVFTQGLAGMPEHILNSEHGIALVASNRGGQVTYHGPGQVVAYPLLDLKRRGYFVKEYVYKLEEAIIRTLAAFAITGHRLRHAPGVYVRLADPFSHAPLAQKDSLAADAFVGLGKIAALGVKVAKHCTYHGLALNVAMDLTPFSSINPCGYAGLATTDMASCGVAATPAEVSAVLAEQLERWLA